MSYLPSIPPQPRKARGTTAPPSSHTTKTSFSPGERAAAWLVSMAEPKSLDFKYYPFPSQTADNPGLTHAQDYGQFLIIFYYYSTGSQVLGDFAVSQERC